MMKAAKDAVAEEAGKLCVEPPLVIGVTLLTSIDERQLREELGVAASVPGHVERMARLAKSAGLMAWSPLLTRSN